MTRFSIGWLLDEKKTKTKTPQLKATPWLVHVVIMLAWKSRVWDHFERVQDDPTKVILQTLQANIRLSFIDHVKHVCNNLKV